MVVQYLPPDDVQEPDMINEQCPQIARQYGIKNKAAITLQCKANVKLNSCLALYIPYSSLI